MNSCPTEILFFDTLYHDSYREKQPEHIRFSHPVYISEVRVLPKSYAVNIRGTTYDGKTDPDDIRIDLFGLDLNSQNKSIVFDKLGTFHYKKTEDLCMTFKKQIPTERLVIKGKFKSLTIVVLGVLARPSSAPVMDSSVGWGRDIPMEPFPSPDVMPQLQQDCSFNINTNVPPIIPSSVAKVGTSPVSNAFSMNAQAQQNFSVPPPLRIPLPSHLNLPPVISPTVIPPPVITHQVALPLIPPTTPMSTTEVSKDITESYPFQSPSQSNLVRKPSGTFSKESKQRHQILSPPNKLENIRIEPDSSKNNDKNIFLQISSDSEKEDENEESLTEEGSHENVKFFTLSEQDLIDFENFGVAEQFHPFQVNTLKFQNACATFMSKFESESSKAKGDLNDTNLTEAQQKFMDTYKKAVCCADEKMHLIYLETLSSLFPTGICQLLMDKANANATETIANWICAAMNYDKVVYSMFKAQTDQTLKLRTWKVGLRLAGQFCFVSDELALYLLKKDIQHKMLNLFNSGFISTPIKLSIIKAMDRVVFTETGMLWFLGLHPEQDNKKETAYETLILKVLHDNEVSRVNNAIAKLLNKAHFYLEIVALRENFGRLLKASKFETKSDLENANLVSVEQEDWIKSVVDSIRNSLESITRVYKNSSELVHQTPTERYALETIATSVFERCRITSDSHSPLLRLFYSQKFIKLIVMLMSHPHTSCDQGIVTCLETLLEEFCSDMPGLSFLISNIADVGILVGIILRESLEGSSLDILGQKIAYSLKVMHSIDSLITQRNLTSAQQKMVGSVDNHEIISILYSLNSLLLNSIGKKSIVNILSLDDNIEHLLAYIRLSGDEESDKIVKHSVSSHFSGNLISVTIKHSNSVQLLEKFGWKIYDICEQYVGQKLSELSEWLSPCLKLKSYSCAEIQVLISELKRLEEDINELPRSLITVLRIINNLIRLDDRYFVGKQKEFYHMFVLCELFNNDCFSIFLSIIQKVCDMFLRSWQLGLPFSSSERFAGYLVLQNCLSIVKEMLRKIVDARGNAFKDMTCVRPLFCLFLVLPAVVPALETDELEEMRQNIIDCFLTYTMPAMNTEGDESSLMNGPWFLMLKEVIQLTLSLPYCYDGGLCLLSELMPMPLPMRLKEAPSEEDKTSIMINRKFVGIQPCLLVTEIQNLIRTIVFTGNASIQKDLRRICFQLADFSHSTALLVVRTLLDLIIEETHDEKLVLQADEMEESIRTFAPDACRVLLFTSSLVISPACKAAFLTLFKFDEASEKKFHELFRKLLNYFNIVSENLFHIYCQDAIMSLVHGLCDSTISLAEESNESKLCNVLPSLELIECIVESLVLHVSNQRQPYTSTSWAIRCLICLCDHDVGFLAVKRELLKNKTALCNLIEKLDYKFDKDNIDYLNAVSIVLEFFKILYTAGDSTQSSITRTSYMSLSEFQDVLQWNTTEDHMLENFLTLLETVQCVNSEDIGLSMEETNSSQFSTSIDPILEEAKSIIEFLKSSPKSSGFEADVNDFFSDSDSIATQFKRRTLFSISDEERNDYWHTSDDEFTNERDEIMDDEEGVKCDLEMLLNTYCGPFNVFAEYEKGFTELKRPRRGKSNQIATPIIATTTGGHRHYVAPMRGHGYNRNFGSQRFDPFRSRPPNTSRPPSMHVDDFYKIEQATSVQQTSQEQLNIKHRDVKYTRRGLMGRGISTRGIARDRSSGVPQQKYKKFRSRGNRMMYDRIRAEKNF